MAITQSSSSKDPNKSSKNNRRVISSVWLIMALLVGSAALALWIFSSAPMLEAKTEAEDEVPAEVLASNIDQITHIDQLNELGSEVKPISFDALVRELRDYPEEFKDSRYLKKNKGKWTVQVMDVSEHEIITDYLSSRDDRSKFAYFRYRDSNNQPRYLLTYGVMASEKSALNASSGIDFDLPDNVKVIPEEISDYLDIIENYELSAPLKDLSKNRTRQVRLQPTKRELAARRNTEASKSSQQNNSNNNNANSNSTANTNNGGSGSSQSQAPAGEIRNSNDTSETLSVQEERNVIVPGSNNDQNSATEQPEKPKNEPSKPKNESRQPPAEPTKPQEAKQNKPAEKNSKPNNSAKSPSNSEDADSIKQLIEEKSE